MDITTEQQGELLVVRLEGRLDAYWADHLSRSLDDAVAGGGHRIAVAMSRVTYMSSVGLRVLVKFYKQLASIGGSLHVTEPADPVRSVLRMAGLEMLLAETAPSAPASTARQERRSIESDDALYEVYDLGATRTATCRAIGSPHALEGCEYAEADCRTVPLPPTTFAIWIGAFGGFADCRSRFGELVAAAGAAAYFPTDGTNVPDYLLSTGAFVPEASFLYALVCDGPFGRLVRFEEKRRGEPVPLSSIAAQALALAGRPHAGVVMLAETAALVGATLRRSPTGGFEEKSDASMFAYPAVRDWLSFSTDPSQRRHLALVAGIVSAEEHPLLDPFLRPLGAAPRPAGHFHAAIFPNRPLAKGPIDLSRAVASLFENETLEGVLHLLTDDRAGIGAGETELVRGAMWIAPIGDVVS